jgi:hypothetical protein
MSRQEVVALVTTLLGASNVQQLGEGSSKNSNEEILTRIEKLMEQNEGLRSDLNLLKEEVHAKARANINHNQLAERLGDYLAPQLETRLSPQFDASEKRMAAAFKAQERHLDDLGNKKIAEMKESLQDATKGLDRAEKTAARLKGALTWSGIGMVSVALLPYVFAAMVVGMLLGLVGQMFGIPEIFGWAWASFAVAEAWWLKLIIAVATVGSALGADWLRGCCFRRRPDQSLIQLPELSRIQSPVSTEATETLPSVMTARFAVAKSW